LLKKIEEEKENERKRKSNEKKNGRKMETKAEKEEIGEKRKMVIVEYLKKD